MKKVLSHKKVLASAMLCGVILSGTAPMAHAVGGQEGTVYGQVTPGAAVWGSEQNDYLGSFKIPTSNGLDDGVFFDTRAEKPRTEFNTLVTFDQNEQLTTNLKVSGSNVSREGLRQIIGATSVGKEISTKNGLSDEVKTLLKSYGYDGDFGQKWGLASQGLTQNIPQNPTDGANGETITVTQGDYVMMAVSASIYNGANPQSFPVPVSTQAITGMFDEGQSAGMTEDFNNLVSALNAMSANISNEVVDSANVMILTYNGNDNGNGDVSYKRAVSFRQSIVLDIADIEKGSQESNTTTTVVQEEASSTPTPSGYDPSGQNTPAPTPEPVQTPTPTPEPVNNTSVEVVTPKDTNNDTQNTDSKVEVVQPTSQKLSMGSSAGAIQKTNTSSMVVGSTALASLMLVGAFVVTRRKLRNS